MFKARWRSDRNKIKVVFRLQFKATQVPQPGWERLVVSLVPMDLGKTTARSEKAVVVDGRCCWDKAIFETVRLSRESKSGKINEKAYRFLVSAAESPKDSLLGDATFDFARYTQVFKPSTVALPLKASNSTPILHVTVQRMQDAAEGRETEENEVRRQMTLQNQLANRDEEADKMCNAASDFNSMKVSAASNSPVQTKMSSNSPHSMHVESNRNLVKLTSFDAMSASESDNNSEQYTPKDPGLNFVNPNSDSRSFISSPANGDHCQKFTANSYNLLTECEDNCRSTTECSVTSAPDASSDGSTNSSEDTGLRERLNGSEVSSKKLKDEIVSLARQLEVSDLELQALRKQVVKERRKEEDLMKEFYLLREERDSLKRKCELLKASEFNIGIDRVNNFQVNGEDLKPLLEEMKQELDHEKNLNSTLHLQLQKTQESNMELILAVKDLEELLEQKSRDMPCACSKQTSVKPEANEDLFQTRFESDFSTFQERKPNKESSETISEHEEDEELEVLTKEKDVEVECSLEQKIADLNEQIELYKKDHDDIEMQMEQLALDFEIVKQENHELSSKLEQSQLREQLKMQYECSAHTSVINDLEAHVEYLEKELEKQLEMFEEDLTCITKAKIEQEQRAIQTEEALWKTKLHNTNIAEHLQKEIKRLAMQMSTAFDSKENLAKQAFAEASELRLQKAHIEASLEGVNEELALIKYQHKTQVHDLLRQIDLKMEDLDQLNLKLKNKNEDLENQKKNDYKKQKTHLEEISSLKAIAEELSQENGKLSEQLEKESKLIAKMEQERSENKSAQDLEVASIRKEAEKTMEELINLSHLREEKDMLITILRSDIETLEVQYDGLKNESFIKEEALVENELEKESLMKEVLQLKDTLLKKEEAISLFEKKTKESTIEVVNLEGVTMEALRNQNNKSATSLHGSKDLVSLHEKIKNLEGELKTKNAALDALKQSYSKKHLCGRCEVLENGLVELEKNGSHVVCKDTIDIVSIPKTNNSVQENNGTRQSPPSEINNVMKICDRNGMDNMILSDTSSPRIRVCSNGSDDHQRNSDEESLREVAALKEKNEAMEIELKEMQERYSQISLKFAEVEGERQQLVMTIRSLKNAMKV